MSITDIPGLEDGIFSFPNLSEEQWNQFRDSIEFDFEKLDDFEAPKEEIASTGPPSSSSPESSPVSPANEIPILDTSHGETKPEIEAVELREIEASSSKGRRLRGKSRKRSWHDAMDDGTSSEQDDIEKTPTSVITSSVAKVHHRKATLLWRKYGQKILRGKQWRGTVRCYYKCHYPLCAAKKLVEKHISDMDKVIEVKLEGSHNHPISDQEWEDSIKMTEEESGALEQGCGAEESSEMESKASINVAVMA